MYFFITGEIQQRISDYQDDLKQLSNEEIERILSISDSNQENIIKFLRKKYSHDFGHLCRYLNRRRNLNGLKTYELTEEIITEGGQYKKRICLKERRSVGENMCPDDKGLKEIRCKKASIENDKKDNEAKAASMHHTSTEMKKLHHDLLEERGQWSESETSAEIVARNADALMKVLNVFVDQPESPLDNPTLMKQVDRFTENMEALQETLVDLGYDKYLGDQLPSEEKMQPEVLAESAETCAVYRGRDLIFWTTVFILPSVLLFFVFLFL